jgi:hypothetical protein
MEKREKEAGRERERGRERACYGVASESHLPCQQRISRERAVLLQRMFDVLHIRSRDHQDVSLELLGGQQTTGQTDLQGGGKLVSCQHPDFDA